MQLREEFLMSTITDVAIREGKGSASSMIVYFEQWLGDEKSIEILEPESEGSEEWRVRRVKTSDVNLVDSADVDK